MSDPTLNAIAARIARLVAEQPQGSEAGAHLRKAARLILDADEALEREGPETEGRAA